MNFADLFDLSEIEDSYIFFFDDFDVILQALDLDPDDFKRLIDDLELWKNIRAKKSTYRNRTITLDSGITMAFDPEAGVFDILDVLDFYPAESNVIVEIDGFPLSDAQRVVLEQNSRNIKRWLKLPHDVFYKVLIEDQNLRGEDLINFCAANKQLNDKCDHITPLNQNVFSQLLRKDFGLVVNAEEAHRVYAERTRYKLWTFGRNDRGQLGHDGDGDGARPGQVLAANGRPFQVKSISCGDGHTAMILTDDTLWTFGLNSRGQLGRAGRRPGQVLAVDESPFRVKSVSCGGLHTAMILIDDTLWTFGDNDWGQLGRGGDRKRPGQVLDVGERAFRVKSVLCGEGHTAMILTDDTLWTFGANNYGQLGRDGNGRPDQVLAANGRRVKSVSCGRLHTAMISTDDTLWTFGENDEGQLGRNGDGNRPGQVLAADGRPFQVLSVSCGARHTAAILTDDTLWTFGATGEGQLGRAGDRGRPSQVLTVDRIPFRVKSISCGGHTAMILTDDTLWTFGYNGMGQLGHDGDGNRPGQVLAADGRSFRVQSVSCGWRHTAMIAY